MPLDVLFVCTGNVCRSPAAAALARAWAGPDAGLAPSSAGLAALVDAPVDPPTAAELNALGVDVADHRARQYAPWMALDAGLVLTATREQAQQILRDVPQAMRRVFTIKEFARLAAHHVPDEHGDGPRTVAAVAALRGQVPAVPGEHDDVLDPYRRSQADARAAVADIAAAVRGTLTALGVAAPTGRRRPLPYPRRAVTGR